MKRVLVPIADGCEEIETVALIDVLRRAGAQVTVASVGQLQITASRGVKFVADCLIEECSGNEFDLIALPGGIPGSEYLRDSEILIDMLKQQQRLGKLIAAICAAPAVVLQHHGLIGHRNATCHPGRADDLPKWGKERVIKDGNLITSQGPGTALEFALKLVECLYDEPKSSEIASAMIMP